ncbi:MAG: hypothetical protein NT027_17355 [Proteobacteria bacterium]|nr:hypothetical protein [Pseudomonadota bacterium]
MKISFIQIFFLVMFASSCRTPNPKNTETKSANDIVKEDPSDALNPSKCGMSGNFICKTESKNGLYTVIVDTSSRSATVSYKNGRKDVTYPNLECLPNNGPFPAPGADTVGNGQEPSPIPEFSCVGNIDPPTIFADSRQIQIDFACDPKKLSELTLKDAKISLLSNAEDIDIADERKDFKCSPK